MKKNSKVRLFEVMSRLDKTFKPRLNEGFEEIEATDDVAIPAETGETAPEQEMSVEEKYEALKNKVEELYAIIHGEETEDEEGEMEEPEGEMNERKKWNFEKKKGEKESDNDEDNESKEHEKSETPAEEKAEHKVNETKAKKIPVAAIAKVGK
jgi:hypothetical protein